MKRCPTCNRTYTDDTLAFCLEDGASLQTASDSELPYDSEPTVRAFAATLNDEPPPTEIFEPRALPTAQMPPPYTQAAQQQRARVTAPDRVDSTSPPTLSPAAATETRPQNTTRVIMFSVLATVLLIAVGSIGAWVLLKDEKETATQNATRDNQKNGAVEAQSNTPGTNSTNATAPPKTANGNRPAPLAPTNGRWFVVLGSYEKTDSASANQRLNSLRAAGYDASIVDTDDYPNFSGGKLAVVMGPYTRTEATATADRMRSVVKDAYAKSGWK
jgi:hypothetical protein